MAVAPDARPAEATVLIFENDPRQAGAYQDLFIQGGFRVITALPSEDVQSLCERVQPQLVLFDMGIWEADTAYVFGVCTNAIGFERPVIIGLATLPHQVRRAKRFGADGVWVRGVDDAAALPTLGANLLDQRRDGKLKPRVPSTPL